MKDNQLSVFWYRRDLRLDDNQAFYHALKKDRPVLPLFIFDTNILDDLEDQDDARVTFIHQRLAAINGRLRKKKSLLLTKQGDPLSVWKELITNYNISAVYTNRDYEPYARNRDQEIQEFLKDQGIAFYDFKDQVIFEKDEVMKDDGDPYRVYTPYSRLWKSKVTSKDLEAVTSALQFENFYQSDWQEILTLEDLGFVKSTIEFPSDQIDDETLQYYGSQRNYPNKQGTSRLGLHLRFGTISLRKLVAKAQELSGKFLNELIWREFFQMILWHYPRVVEENFYTKYDALHWRNNKDEFDRWCEGTTGYPLVDAGMRELNATGYMHNRVRMLAASFLTKHLLIDWRWGEAYFARKLLDYELASNNGNWQWAAGTGVDAAPYFRIFNPHTQLEKFDKKRQYVGQWIPELDTSAYQKPVVEHKQGRERALQAFKKALN